MTFEPISALKGVDKYWQKAKDIETMLYSVFSHPVKYGVLTLIESTKKSDEC